MRLENIGLQRAIYRHYKGDLYVTLGAVWDATNDRPMIHYEAVGGIPGRTYVRTVEDFTALVEQGGDLVPRFKLIEPLAVTSRSN